MQASEATSDAPGPAGERPQLEGEAAKAGRIVLRNTMYLGIAEVLSMPIQVLLNAMMGRYLGPEDIGHIYLATTITSLAFLAVQWGHAGSLPAAVVLDLPGAGKFPGSSILWRLSASFVAYAVVALGCYALGFTGQQQWAIGLVFLAYFFASIVSAFQDVIRGFERTDIAAYSRVGMQLISAGLTIPVLMLGGRMKLALFVQAIAVLFVLVPLFRVIGRVGIGKLQWDRARFKQLMAKGTPFVFFSLALVLQPNVDAFYLAKLSSPDVVGWYAVSHRLIGFLLMPATALIGALYPTLCRLYVTDQDSFRSTTRGSLSTVSLLVVPVALGCALYPDIGVSIFGREAFGPAEDTLRLFSIYLFLVYFSMPVGTALVAAGRQRAWTFVQLFCVVNSAVLDPFLISHFQETQGNGGLGLTIAAATSETFMVCAGIYLMPRGIFDRGLAKSLALAALSGGAMVGAALALRGIPSLLAAPFAVVAYALALYLTGAVSKEQMASFTGFVRRKLARNKAAA
jgi:O-antigen/teichoic acid export membrane protein